MRREELFLLGGCLTAVFVGFLSGLGTYMALDHGGGRGAAGPTAAAESPAPVMAAVETETIPQALESPAATEPEGRAKPDGGIQSCLTGEMTDVSQADRRPLAVMMSNDKQALPQYGINRAGVVYEAPVEGDMNRFMAILENYDDLERIGPVRSCRTYYIYFAREFDAIYSHYGQSTFALPYLSNVDDINGLKGAGASAFYRSKDRRAPHNAYTSFALTDQAVEKLGFSREYSPDYQGHYRFAGQGETIELPDGQDAFRVAPGYRMNNPWFEYHEEDGLYYRFQYGAPHLGDEGQIAVRNILLQYCQSGHYATTAYLNINVHTSERGYYVTGGKAIPVTWRKDGEFGPTRYYDSDGREIVLNRGKTWVCIIPSAQYDKTEFYGK